MAFPTAANTNWFKITIRDVLYKTTNALDWDTNTIKAAMFTDTITGTFAFDSDLGYGTAPWNANEASTTNTGYTSGGATLSAGKTVAVSPASTLKITSTTNPVWTTTSGTLIARGVLVYDSTAQAAGTVGNGLIAQNFGSDKTASGGGTFTVTWDANGIMTIT